MYYVRPDCAHDIHGQPVTGRPPGRLRWIRRSTSTAIHDERDLDSCLPVLTHTLSQSQPLSLPSGGAEYILFPGSANLHCLASIPLCRHLVAPDPLSRHRRTHLILWFPSVETTGNLHLGTRTLSLPIPSSPRCLSLSCDAMLLGLRVYTTPARGLCVAG